MYILGVAPNGHTVIFPCKNKFTLIPSLFAHFTWESTIDLA